MRLSILILGAALAVGGALPGAALAHDYGGQGYAYGHLDRGRDIYRHHYNPRRHARRHWRHDHRDYRPHYRPHYRPRYRDYDDRWGIQLFFSGH